MCLDLSHVIFYARWNDEVGANAAGADNALGDFLPPVLCETVLIFSHTKFRGDAIRHKFSFARGERERRKEKGSAYNQLRAKQDDLERDLELYVSLCVEAAIMKKMLAKTPFH